MPNKHAISNSCTKNCCHTEVIYMYLNTNVYVCVGDIHKVQHTTSITEAAKNHKKRLELQMLAK